ncbi:hypothetical protein DICPUDRAFT_97248 [Dictyostelium purpureum]|uniref:Cytochrome b561 domain-containing protein n=1 Tax=Dictyostelium purpureum TaxID=5786 RepID=F0ZF28_DICPU|nr:uncharacterized protein DICPUDRAFT_97248 [Dictyostelium purpureum]EGC37463.1 hypothetical protein DICPUDRAFT_97248 [Dictyostelium purpureum]|eukprot:XP_003286027.1 hypothetical protein DICPUDRAFT_97248 [Dictyostelium purpureum]
MKSIIIFFTLLLITLSICHEGHDHGESGTGGTATSTNTVLLDAETNFVLTWDVDQDAEELYIGLTGNFAGWLAFGYKCIGDSMECEMGHPDIIAITYNSLGEPDFRDKIDNMDKGVVDDSVLNGTNNDFVTYGGTQTAHHTMAYFKRKFNTGDANADYIIDINQPFEIVWYIGTGFDFDFTDYTKYKYGTATINLLDSGAAQTDDTVTANHDVLLAWHAALMSISFGILIPFAIFSIRYLGGFKWAFYFHLCIQALAISFIIVGFILALVAHKGVQHTSDPHSVFGIVTFALVLFTACGGILTWLFKKEGNAIFPNQIHKYFGRLVSLVSIGTIMTGLNQYSTDSKKYQANAFIVVYAILLLTYAIIAITLEIFKRKYGLTPGGEKNVKMDPMK